MTSCSFSASSPLSCPTGSLQYADDMCAEEQSILHPRFRPTKHMCFTPTESIGSRRQPLKTNAAVSTPIMDQRAAMYPCKTAECWQMAERARARVDVAVRLEEFENLKRLGLHKGTAQEANTYRLESRTQMPAQTRQPAPHPRV